MSHFRYCSDRASSRIITSFRGQKLNKLAASTYSNSNSQPNRFKTEKFHFCVISDSKLETNPTHVSSPGNPRSFLGSEIRLLLVFHALCYEALAMKFCPYPFRLFENWYEACELETVLSPTWIPLKNPVTRAYHMSRRKRCVLVTSKRYIYLIFYY